MHYASDDNVREFYAGQTAGDLAVTTTRNLAADLVSRWAPVPDPLPSPDDYTPKAKRAELFVGRYLWATQGYISGRSLSGVGSRSFKDDKEVRRIVKESMGDYYTAGESYTIAVDSSFVTNGSTGGVS